jgi:Bacterial Ig-like domain
VVCAFCANHFHSRSYFFSIIQHVSFINYLIYMRFSYIKLLILVLSSISSFGVFAQGPTANILVPYTVTDNPFVMTITFSEPVTGLQPSDFYSYNCNVVGVTAVGSTGSVYVLTVTPATSSSMYATLPANTVQGLGGTPNSQGSNYASTFYNPSAYQGPKSTLSVDNVVTTDPFNMYLTFSEPVSGLDINDFLVYGCAVTAFTPTSSTGYTLTVTPLTQYSVTAGLASNSVTSISGVPNTYGSNYAYTTYEQSSPPPPPPPSCLAEYYLSEGNDGYYTVSLISHTDWSGTDAIVGTAQVTIKVGTAFPINGGSIPNTTDVFTVTDLTMLVPGVNWTLNSRYNSPNEDPWFDYLSFGMTTYGSNLVPFVNGDTVPLFRFKNTGICNDLLTTGGDSVRLMPIVGDPFAWPNQLNANVGQQLSVSGYNEPDVPLCVSGAASCMAEVKFDFKALLQGAYISADGMMHDQLRQQNLIPTTEPYSGYLPVRGSNYEPFLHADDGGGERITDPFTFTEKRSVEDNIVDWVMIELRDQLDSSVITTRSVLVQRDGDIRDTLGDDLVVFRKLRAKSYFFTVRHRNHLGLMTAGPVSLTNLTNTYNFSDTINKMIGEYVAATTPVFADRPGDPLVFTKYPGVVVDGKRLLWAGNSNADNYIMFQGGGIGEGLDIDNVFDNIFSDPLNANYSYNHVRDGYYPGDNNMDGKVKYQGPANDVDPFIFFNIISRHPDNVSKFVNFYITEGIPRD